MILPRSRVVNFYARRLKTCSLLSSGNITYIRITNTGRSSSTVQKACSVRSLCQCSDAQSKTVFGGRNTWESRHTSFLAALTCGWATLSFLDRNKAAAEEEHHLDETIKRINSEKLAREASVVGEYDEDEMTTLLNWSGTHSVHVPTKHYYEPETVEELAFIVKKSVKAGTKIRPVGSVLSPNAIAFESGGMVSLSQLDKILRVDEENMTVTVQAGARVSQVVEALRPYRLTLPNLASIAEQQIGGFIQVGAHGTGATIPPCDDFVMSMKMIAPSCGTVTLTPTRLDGTANPLFHVAKVGLGCLGIVTEVTLKCVPAHNLVEHTFVLTRAEARDRIDTLLKMHKHVRYMWIPYTDSVVVVTNDPECSVDKTVLAVARKDDCESDEGRRHRFQPLTDLLQEVSATDGPKGERFTDEQLIGMGFGEIRDALLASRPLNVDHVKNCNNAEAEFWRRSAGYQIKPSDQLLQFDCGGQQWVKEVCFPTGSYEQNNGNDMRFMQELLKGIEENDIIAAHSPIEQRWTASSSSFMSPAYGPPGALHSWVGIIMYLPTDDEDQKRTITNVFRRDYCDLLQVVGSGVGAASHWAKLEMPESEEELRRLRDFTRLRYPVQLFNYARYTFDPLNLLSNDLMNALFGYPKGPS